MRNFLAGEISGSFEKVLKFGLKSDIAKICDEIETIISLSKEKIK